MIAKAVGMSFNTLKKWMSKNYIPPLDITIGLVRYFGVSFEFLIYGTETVRSTQLTEIINLQKEANEKLEKIRVGEGK